MARIEFNTPVLKVSQRTFANPGLIEVYTNSVGGLVNNDDLGTPTLVNLSTLAEGEEKWVQIEGLQPVDYFRITRNSGANKDKFTIEPYIYDGITHAAYGDTSKAPKITAIDTIEVGGSGGVRVGAGYKILEQYSDFTDVLTATTASTTINWTGYTGSSAIQNISDTETLELTFQYQVFEGSTENGSGSVVLKIKGKTWNDRTNAVAGAARSAAQVVSQQRVQTYWNQAGIIYVGGTSADNVVFAFSSERNGADWRISQVTVAKITEGPGSTELGGANFGAEHHERLIFNRLMLGSGALATFEDLGEGTIYTKGIAVFNASDRRLKDKLGGIEGALAKLKSLEVLIYQFNSKGIELGVGKAGEEHLGLYAQEVESLFPQVVKEVVRDEDGTVYKTIMYDRLVPVLVRALQEQNMINEELKARLDKLEKGE